MEEAAKDVVWVSPAKGKPATGKYKVSIAYRDGFTASGMLAIGGGDAVGKAKLAGQILLDRLRRAGHVFARSQVEIIGAGSLVPGLGVPAAPPAEVMLRVAVHDASRAAVERFTKEFAPLVTAGPPGVTGYTTGRPHVREVFAYWPALVESSAVPARVEWE